MKLSELILAVGDDKVLFQSLDTSATSLDWSRKAGSRITFRTEEMITPGEGTVRLGLVVWLDREAVAAALGAAGVTFAPRSARPDESGFPQTLDEPLPTDRGEAP